MVLHGLLEARSCIVFQTLSHSFFAVWNQFLYPLLNCVYGSFLFLWERTAKADIGALLIDLDELLSCKLSLIRYQAGPDCKVPFCSYIVPFVIMSMVQSGVIEVPVPGYKLYTRASKPPSQHCAVKLSKCLIRLRQPHCLDRRCMFQMVHIFQNCSGHVCNLGTCLFSFRQVHILLTVENSALIIDPA